MYNDLLTIGPVTFHTYGLMTAVGIISAYLTAESGAKRKKLDAEQIFGLVISCLVSGYAGSKLLYILTVLPQLMADPSLWRESLSTGWVVFGGLLGGIFGGWVFCRMKNLPVWKFFDIGMPSVALAQGFGRIGCFFAGCCYGVETDSPFSIVFTHSDFAPNHVHLVPTQLLSAAGDFALAFFLWAWDRKRKKRDGEVTALYLILYSAGRFVIEFWRGDLIRGAIGPLSTSQFIALFTLAAGCILFWVRKGPGKGTDRSEDYETRVSYDE